MAKIVFGPSGLRAMCSATAHAMESPSKVAVPRPISSSSTRLRPVAWRRMWAVSCISTMNVLCPRRIWSLAPTRVKTRSTRAILASRAGTKLPTWAMTTTSAVWRRKVDLPPMLGPVRTNRRGAPSPMARSFATNGSARTRSMTGWRPST